MKFPHYLKHMFASTAGGLCVTVGSTAAACMGALYVERTAHRTLYRFFPHWYRDVEYAFGLEPHLLEAVRTSPSETSFLQPEEKVERKQNPDWVERNVMYADRTSQQLFNCALTA
jgi:hypothetical protein